VPERVTLGKGEVGIRLELMHGMAGE